MYSNTRTLTYIFKERGFLLKYFYFRTLVTTTVLCYFLGVHDFMLVITGSLADIAGSATEVALIFNMTLIHTKNLKVIKTIISRILAGFWYNIF